MDMRLTRQELEQILNGAIDDYGNLKHFTYAELLVMVDDLIWSD